MKLKSIENPSLLKLGLKKKSIHFIMFTLNRYEEYNKYLFPIDAEYFLSKEENFDNLSQQFEQMLLKENAKMKKKMKRNNFNRNSEISV